MPSRTLADRHRRRWIAVAALAAVLTGGPTSIVVRPADAADPDPWFGHDKELHFTISAAIAAGGFGAAAAAGDNRPWRVAVGAGLALTAGVGKELADLGGAGDASWKDLTWDVIGTATGLGVAWLVDWLVSRSTGPTQ